MRRGVALRAHFRGDCLYLFGGAVNLVSVSLRIGFFEHGGKGLGVLGEQPGHAFEPVSYTHLTLPTNREV